MRHPQGFYLSLGWLPLIFTLLVCGALFVVEPPAWAAPVPVLSNQTVPPFAFDLYLPRLVGSLWLTNLTNSPAIEHSPAWSYDGAHVAFIRLEGDRHQIRSINADGTNPLLLLDEQGEFPSFVPLQAIWSPDGSRIAYIRDEGIRNLYVMQADGSAKHIIASEPNLTDPTWSPDGRRIAFSSNGAIYTVAPDGSNLTMLVGHAAAHVMPVWSPDSSQIAYYDSSANALVIQDVTGFAMRQLPNSTKITFNYSRFLWSPNGKMIAFDYETSGEDGQPVVEIGVVEIAGGKLTRVTNHFAEEHDLAWSPDSSKLAFARSADIHVINIDGSDHRILTQGFGEESLPAWSPDGSRIAFISDHENRHDVYVIDAGGGTPTRLTDDVSIEQSVAWSSSGNYLLIEAYVGVDDGVRLMSAEGGASINPLPEIAAERFVWSPVTLQVAFTARRLPALTELYRVDVDGNNLIKLSAELSVDYFAWSPDGQKLLFTVVTGENAADIYLVDAGGAHLTKLAMGALTTSQPNPAWSPDGSRIAFANGDLYLLEVANGTLTNLTKFTGTISRPFWSPNGEWLAYFAPANDIYVVDTEGGAPTQVTNDMAEGFYPEIAWSPDSRTLAYVNGQYDPTCNPKHGCNPEIYSLSIANVDGSNHKVVEEDGYQPTWSPDGRYLLYLSYESGLVLVNAEGANRRELGVKSDFDFSWSPDGSRILLGFAQEIYIFHPSNLP